MFQVFYRQVYVRYTKMDALYVEKLFIQTLGNTFDGYTNLKK